MVCGAIAILTANSIARGQERDHVEVDQSWYSDNRLTGQHSIDEIAAIEVAFAEAGLVDYEIEGKRVYVPRAQLSLYLSALKQQEVRLRKEPKTPETVLEAGSFADQITPNFVKANEMCFKVHATNIANKDTPSFKKRAAVLTQQGDSRSCVVKIRTDFSQGKLRRTGRELDIAIEGEGFIQVSAPSGETLYTRIGFGVDREGRLTAGGPHGYIVEPRISFPSDASEISIDPRGAISVRSDPNARSKIEVGAIQLATFESPENLICEKSGLFAVSEDSGYPIVNMPGTGGAGTIRQRAIELSNVDLMEEIQQIRRVQQIQSLLTAILLKAN